jgi:hypothetical protein
LSIAEAEKTMSVLSGQFEDDHGLSHTGVDIGDECPDGGEANERCSISIGRCLTRDDVLERVQPTSFHASAWRNITKLHARHQNSAQLRDQSTFPLSRSSLITPNSPQAMAESKSKWGGEEEEEGEEEELDEIVSSAHSANQLI